MDRGNVLPWTFVGVMDRGNVLPWRPWEVLWTEVIVTMDLGRCYGHRYVLPWRPWEVFYGMLPLIILWDLLEFHFYFRVNNV